MIWRVDPLVLTEKIHIEDLLQRIEYIGNALKGYTEKLVFSYADILQYRKVKLNLERNGILYKEWDEDSMKLFAQNLASLNKRLHLSLATCGERIDLSMYGIMHNRCIDDELIIKRAYNDKTLMKFLKVKMYPMPTPTLFGDTEPIPNSAILLPNNMYAIRGDNKDKGQRDFCGCMCSKDIGEYNTCAHLYEYCYANTSKEIAVKNLNQHRLNPLGETITGR